MTSLAEIRKKLQAMESRSSGKSTNYDNAIFPFWNMKEGETSNIRFLPDGNPDNTFFWVEKNVIKLPFPGIKGEDSKPVIVEVPCVEMWGDTCPILTEVRPMFKDPSMETLARKYWKKRSYIFQGFVQSTEMEEENKPDSPIRRFILGPQIFNIVKQILMDPDVEEIPTDYVKGLDFKLVKASKGGFADYSTSQWARRESSLDDDQMEAIDEHGLADLSDFLPARPTDEQVTAMMEMFEASLEEEEYDPDRWAKYYRPKGYQFDTGSSSNAEKAAKAVPANKPAPKKEEVKEDTVDEADDSIPFDTDDKDSEGTAGAADILNMIRNRKQ